MNIRKKVVRGIGYAVTTLCTAFAWNAKASWTYSGATTSATLTEDVESGNAWVLKATRSSGNVTITGVTTVGDSTTLDFTTISGTSTYVGKVTTFGEYAFNDATAKAKIECVIAPEATSFNGNTSGAFKDCTNLVDVVWKPDSKITVGKRAFQGCARLSFPRFYDASTGWTVMSNVTSVAMSSFNGCGLAGKVSFPDLSCGTMGREYALGAPDITELKVNFTSGNVSASMFAASTGSKLEVLSGLYGCSYALTALNSLPLLNLITIGSDTLGTKISLPKGNSSYSHLGYGSVANLEHVYLGNNVTNIGAWTFYNCKKLNYIRWPGMKPGIGSNAFGSAGTAKDTVLRQYFPYTNETWRAEITGNENYTAWDALDPEDKEQYTAKYGTAELPDGYCSAYADLRLRKGFVFFYGKPTPPPVVGPTTEQELVDAIAAITTEGTITLGGDITLTQALVIPAGKTITLNLNMKTLTATGWGIKNAGTLTIDNGAITAVEGAITLYGNSVTTIKGGTYTSTDNAVIMGQGSEGNGNVTLTINGGTFTGGITTAGYIACGLYVPNSGTYTISGGTFNITGGCGICARAGTTKIADDVVINLSGDTTAKGWVGDKKSQVPCVVAYFDWTIPPYPGYADGDTIKAQNNTLTTADDQEWSKTADGEGYYTLQVKSAEEPITPGQDMPTYTGEDAEQKATEAAAKAVVKRPNAAVEEVISAENYNKLFTVKPVDNGDGSWTIIPELEESVAKAEQAKADAAQASIAETAATTPSATVLTQAGLYYGIAGATEPGDIEGSVGKGWVLGNGEEQTVTIDKVGTEKGFYQMRVSAAPENLD